MALSFAPALRCAYSTSGASDTIFMKRSVRSSRVTGPKMRVPDRLQLVVQQHGGIAVELDQRAVLATHALGSAHHDRAVDLALLDAATRRSFLDRHLDDVANAGIPALGATQHLDAHDGLGARVVSDVESRLHLDHLCPQLVPSKPAEPVKSVSLGPVIAFEQGARRQWLGGSEGDRSANVTNRHSAKLRIMQGKPSARQAPWPEKSSGPAGHRPGTLGQACAARGSAPAARAPGAAGCRRH